MINRMYYQDEHYVWCSPYFKADAVPRFAASAPPTAIPASIYERLRQDVAAGDKHSVMVTQNRIGIRKGADAKLGSGLITSIQRDEIIDIVDAVDIQEFRPLIYVMPYADVRSIAAKVPVAGRAHPLSVEYIIERLPGILFDIIELS